MAVTCLLPTGCLDLAARRHSTKKAKYSSSTKQSTWHCQKACQNNADCLYFSFNFNSFGKNSNQISLFLYKEIKSSELTEGDNNCFLFEEAAESVSMPKVGWISGQVNCSTSANPSDFNTTIMDTTGSTTNMIGTRTSQSGAFTLLLILNLSIGEERQLSKILVTTGKLQDGPETHTQVSEIIDIEEDNNHGATCNDFMPYPFDILYGTGGLIKTEDGEKEAVVICGGHGTNQAIYVMYQCHYAFDKTNYFVENVIDMKYGQRTSATSLVIDNGLTLWITGGMAGDRYTKLSTTEYIRLSPTPSSQEGPELVHAMDRHCIVRLSSTTGNLQALFIGGRITDNSLQNTWYFDEDNTPDLWSDGPSLSYSRADLGCGVLRDKDMDRELVLVAGGIDQFILGHTSVEYLVLNNENSYWHLKEGVLCDARVGSAGIVAPDKSKLILIGGRLKRFSHPYHKSLCSCQMVNGNPSCEFMDQQLRIGRAFMPAMLIPDSFANCSN